MRLGTGAALRAQLRALAGQYLPGYGPEDGGAELWCVIEDGIGRFPNPERLGTEHGELPGTTPAEAEANRERRAERERLRGALPVSGPADPPRTERGMQG